MKGLRERLRTLLHGHGGLLTRYTVSSVGRTGSAMAGIFLIERFLSGVLGDRAGFAADLAESVGPTGALWIVAGLLVAAYLGASLFRYDSIVAEQRILRSVELRVMEKLVTHLLSLSVPFFEAQERGDMIQSIRQDVASLRTVLMSYLTVFVEGMLALGLIVAAFLISPLTLAMVAVLLVAALPIFVIARRTRLQSRQVRRSSYVLYDIILQFLSGIRIIKVYRGEEEEARQAVEKTRNFFAEKVKMVQVESLATVVLESFSGFSLVFVVVAGGFQVLNGQLDWPSLLAFLMAMAAVHRPLNKIGYQVMLAQRHSASVDRIAELMEERSKMQDGELPFPSEPVPLEVRDLCFSRGEAKVLQDVSFEVRPGEILGIVGPSGAGKSTLLNLVARFYDPDSGTITYGGEDLRSFIRRDYYRRLAIVTQEPFLFSASVRENIQCGRAEANDQEVEAAAKAAEIHAEILELPEGYETQVGLGGRGLSLGQAQRLNVARAVLKGPPILLLDEATSSLDSVSESKVQQALDRLSEGRTTLVVAHRISTLRNADRLLVLEDGRAVGSGSHVELLQTCPTYARMWETQKLKETKGQGEQPALRFDDRPNQA